MTILKKQKAIFIHIPKTGGKFVRKHLKMPATLPWPTMHRRPSDDVLVDKWEKYFTFTFVRHPLDRFVSAYFFDHKRNSEGVQNNKSGIMKEIIKFQKNKQGVSNFVKNFYHQNFFDDYKFIPQTCIMENAKFNFIGRFENLKKDTEQVYHKIYQKPLVIKKNKKINSTTRDHYLQYFTDEALNTLVKYYKEDYIKLNY